jgi:hypothetical protein
MGLNVPSALSTETLLSQRVHYNSAVSTALRWWLPIVDLVRFRRSGIRIRIIFRDLAMAPLLRSKSDLQIH